MRRVLATLLLLVASPALAATWSNYVSPRADFSLDIPPGFEVSHDTGGETTIFHRDDGAAFIAVSSANYRGRGFAAVIAEKRELDQDYGWNISYRRETPNWISYSGTLEGRIRYARAIALCDGRAAHFVIDYEKEEKRLFDPIVTRLVRSLRPEGSC